VSAERSAASTQTAGLVDANPKETSVTVLALSRFASSDGKLKIVSGRTMRSSHREHRDHTQADGGARRPSHRMSAPRIGQSDAHSRARGRMFIPWAAGRYSGLSSGDSPN